MLLRCLLLPQSMTLPLHMSMPFQNMQKLLYYEYHVVEVSLCLWLDFHYQFTLIHFTEDYSTAINGFWMSNMALDLCDCHNVLTLKPASESSPSHHHGVKAGFPSQGKCSDR